ncbi:Abi family protein [Avibacterium sp. 20-126]|uniref:Abi family protein n=1 Tax=Avibacterium sp. 20-126 TaxID=2911524 RepID=UPI00218B7422|nr:Abi family protein [Avibacterium sp. 20-126]
MSLTKPFCEYNEMLSLLNQRKMKFKDKTYALKKLSQIGYYRLSGFWYVARQQSGNILTEDFISGTYFESICELYIFDKKLRILLLDIIERIEIHIRNIIAHELGRIDPLAYQYAYFIDKSQRSRHQQWLADLDKKVKRSQDDFILHYVNQGKPIPFWVIVNVWDFGSLSKYYSLLDKTHQDTIVKYFNIDRATFGNWLQQLNYLRNCAAHHNRVWNRLFSSDIVIPTGSESRFKRYKKATSYFDKLPIYDPKRVFSRIAVLWFLVSQFSQNYKWLDKLDRLTNKFPTIPNVRISSMGFHSSHTNFPITDFS